ncbi:MAG: glycosyltransferase family 2 protein [Lachnospiraceae bacterium]|nr:glycosyltransferase family 2 protein [Lachnospiraceae bacterium]
MLTIFTPTFNRKHLLPKLYRSLLSQTCKDFTWLIIDDGSTDGTKLLVQSWIAEKQIPLRYVYQQNGGKMRAHNRAVELCETELFLCIDSDDSLAEDAVEIILKTWEHAGKRLYEPGQKRMELKEPNKELPASGRKLKNSNRKAEEQRKKSSLAGLAAYKGKTPTETMQGEQFPPGLTRSTLSGLYRKGFQGETTLVFRTDLLRQHPFPEFSGEKFIPEAVVYDQIDQDHELFLLPKVLTLCKYQPDGLTAGIRRLRRENPKGWLCYYQQRISREPKGILRYKYIVHAVCFAWQVRESIFGCIPAGKLEILTAVPAAVLFRLVGRL